MSVVQLRTDRPMPEIARACVDALLAGQDVQLSTASWRRPGLAQAIAAEQRARGTGTGQWAFVDPAGTDQPSSDPLPEADDILGWGDRVSPAPGSRRALRAAETSPVPVPVPAVQVAVPAPVTAPQPHLPVQRTVPVNHPVTHPPVVPTPPPVAAPVPAAQLGQPSSQPVSMLQAAYAMIAFSQPVMAAGLKPGPTRQRTFGTPSDGRRWTAAQAMAELAELDGL